MKAETVHVVQSVTIAALEYVNIEKRFLFINEYCLCCIARKECVQKKVTEKETLVHTEGAGVKISPFFSSSKRGHILMEGRVKIFLSHVP